MATEGELEVELELKEVSKNIIPTQNQTSGSCGEMQSPARTFSFLWASAHQHWTDLLSPEYSLDLCVQFSFSARGGDSSWTIPSTL